MLSTDNMQQNVNRYSSGKFLKNLFLLLQDERVSYYGREAASGEGNCNMFLVWQFYV